MSLTTNIQRNWAQMELARKKRTTAILVLIVLALGFVILTGNKPLLKKPDTSNKPTSLVAPQTRSLSSQDVLDTLQAQNRALADMQTQIAQMKLTSPASAASQPAINEDAVRSMVADAVARASANKGAAVPPPPTDAANPAAGAITGGAPLTPNSQFGDSSPIPDGIKGSEANTGPRFRTLTDSLPGTASNASEQSTAPLPPGTRVTPTGIGKSRSKSGRAGIYLPPGTILPYFMLSGMNAPTNQSSTRDPMPALLRIRGDVIMPNGYTADLNDCMVTVSGYGQMADERAMLRTEKMSCVRSDGMAIEVDMKGYVTGEDGKPGIHGRLASKTGEVIAQLLKTGALSTLGNVVASTAPILAERNQGSNNVTVNTGNSQTAASVAAGQAASGFNNVMDKIANVYAEYAKETFPVIEISPGREGNIQLIHGLEIPQ